jgi:hypothetical protein
MAFSEIELLDLVKVKGKVVKHYAIKAYGE